MKPTKKKVIRVDKSPLNPKRKCIELECGHEVWRNRAVPVGSMLECHACKPEPEKKS